MLAVDVIAQILKQEGTEFLTGFPRTPLIEACAKVGIRPILCRQERVGISIADGFTRTTAGRRIGVVATQQGPGAENAFPGIAQAYAEGVPVLYIPGGEAPSRQFTQPNFSAVDNYRHVTKWAAQITDPSQVVGRMRRAFHLLRNGKPGPVLLEVMRDVWEAECPDGPDYHPPHRHRSAPDPEDVAAVAEALVAARTPMIFAGAGVLRAEATDALIQLAELLDAPVMATNPGKSAFPENHPLSLGASLGRSRSKGAQYFLDHCDCVFAIGSSLTRTNFGPSVPAGKTILHATDNADDINKDYSVAHAMIGDAALSLEALVYLVEDILGTERRGTERADTVQVLKREWQDDWMDQLTSDEVPINPYRIIWDLLQSVDRDQTIVTHDSGSPREQFFPFWETTTPRSYMGWGKSTQLGHGLGLVMGAKIAEPDKLCINVMGDAAIGMVGMDLETAVRNRLGILTIVFNNGIMAAERDSLIVAEDDYGALQQGGNYARVADGLGVAATRIEDAADFLPALKDALAAIENGQPALIECMTKEGQDFSRYD
jgi:acetolactate synthase-1/2/3 large subunit